MNKATYLQELRKALKVLPQAERDDTIEFYDEYFDDAGVDNEAKVIEELGTPKELAKKILVDLVDKKYSNSNDEEDMNSSEYTDNSEKKKSNKESSALRTFLVVMAAILALPLSPVLFALFIVLAVAAFLIIITFIALIASGAVMLIFGLVVAICAFFLMFASFGKSLVMLGSGLLCFGLGVLFVIGFAKLLSLFCAGVSALFAKLVHKNK